MSFDFSVDPFVHLQALVKEATEKGLSEPTAMQLATVSENGQPSVRTVLFKGLIRGGLSFYTNYKGRKGRELATRSRASVNFFWPELQTQIRVEGEVFPLTRAESEAYFKTRPRLSQLGAWASAQSEEIPSLEVLERKILDLEKNYPGEVPCPPHWGGYHLLPDSFEFWFGRQGRLHERCCYEKRGDSWRTFLRAP